ncbi:MAG: hypothetical protein IKJ13_06410 [Clostridia bacterium]|nr:hypothetical protein [Clostridia bacterium]
MGLLEQLWRECKKREVCEKNKEIKKLKSNMINAEDVLRESLSETSDNLFDEYDTYRTEYEEYAEQKAFEQGVSFAVRFILESLG